MGKCKNNLISVTFQRLSFSSLVLSVARSIQVDDSMQYEPHNYILDTNMSCVLVFLYGHTLHIIALDDQEGGQAFVGHHVVLIISIQLE